MKIFKRLVAVLMLLTMLLSLTSCGAPDACESCNSRNKKLTKVTYEGEKIWVCETCNALIQLAIGLKDLY